MIFNIAKKLQLEILKSKLNDYQYRQQNTIIMSDNYSTGLKNDINNHFWVVLAIIDSLHFQPSVGEAGDDQAEKDDEHSGEHR